MFSRSVSPRDHDVGLILLLVVSGGGPRSLRRQGGQQPQLHRANQHDEEPPRLRQVSPGEATI